MKLLVDLLFAFDADPVASFVIALTLTAGAAAVGLALAGVI